MNYLIFLTFQSPRLLNLDVHQDNYNKSNTNKLNLVLTVYTNIILNLITLLTFYHFL